jgi:ubiquinone/menaquinone biosynthesis C-methylase UbiE
MTDGTSARETGQCCASLYDSDIARILQGSSFHPGGEATTKRLGVLMGLGSTSRVLDVACGQGESALLLADHFGCAGTGVDLSDKSIAAARDASVRRDLAGRTEFIVGDAASLDFSNEAFDAILCECAFCLFPDKDGAALNFARLLKPKGIVGLSDLTREGALPGDLDGLLAWVACVADAQPVDVYRDTLRRAGFDIQAAEPVNWALAELVQQMRMRLLSAEVMVALKRLTLPDFDFEAAKRFAKAALAATENGQLGYALIVGAKS